MNALPYAWMSLLLPAERFESVEVRLPDGTVRTAVWTGAKWWSERTEIKPVAWRPLERMEMRYAV